MTGGAHPTPPVDRYTCADAFRRLDDFLDRELSATEMTLVREHLAVCEACAREFSFEASVLAGVKRRLRHVEMPESLRTRVLAALRREPGA